MKHARRFFLIATFVAMLSSSSMAYAGFVVGNVDLTASISRDNGNNLQSSHTITNLQVAASTGTGGWTNNPAFVIIPPGSSFSVGDDPAGAITFGDSVFGSFSSNGSATEGFVSGGGNAGTRTITWQGVFTTGSSGFYTSNGLNHNASVRLVISKQNANVPTVIDSFTMTTAVPEPTSLGLVATALISGIPFLRRRRNSP